MSIRTPLPAATPLAHGGTYYATQTVAGPLPVVLTQFTATAEGRAAVQLAWTTAWEKNSLGFEVERGRAHLCAHLYGRCGG